jgi:endonuclease-3
MKSIEKIAKKIQSILDSLYPNPLPTLQYKSHYQLLVAVLLSARCTDIRVNQVTPMLFALARNPREMLGLSIDQIQNAIRPCGLSLRKATCIYELSRQILEKHGGEVPQHLQDLEALPGVGHKTASVVMSHAFGKPNFPVDTHIHRCAKRWKLTQGKNVRQTEADLKATFPMQNWNKLHLQIIYFGREHCQAKKHDPKQCPICSLF